MASKGKKSTQRKLTAILSADVVGNSRPMGENEKAPLRAPRSATRCRSGTNSRGL